jgi:hypothetical protein
VVSMPPSSRYGVFGPSEGRTLICLIVQRLTDGQHPLLDRPAQKRYDAPL